VKAVPFSQAFLKRFGSNRPIVSLTETKTHIKSLLKKHASTIVGRRRGLAVTIHANRFTPLSIRAGHRLRNRVVVPAMASETADSHGLATPATLARYRRLAEAQAGLLNVEYTFVSPSGRSEPNQLGAASDDHVPGLREIAAIIKSSGAVAGLQLVHAGGKTTRDLSGGVIMGPSDVVVPVKDRRLEAPTPMSQGDIAHWHQAFLDAAKRAAIAGFDLVELHCAHGYGLNQWLSPLTNRRTDDYGRDLAARTRLVREIVASIRADFPQLLVAARIPGQDFLPGGLTVDDMIVVTRDLVAAGLDIVSVSSGLGGWRRPKDRTMEGYLVEEATRIQAATPRPVVGVGGIESAAYIDQVVGEGRIALAAVGRAILADPAQWRQRTFPNDTNNEPKGVAR
jgi:NADPH2 dehydrogenase